MKTYKVTIANEASNYTSTKYNDTLNGFTSEEAASKAAKQALRDAAGELMKWDAICYIETLNAWVLANNGNWLLVAKVEETPEIPNPDNTPNISDLARWIDIQLSTIIDGVSAGYTLGNYNSVWIDKGATVFNVSLANGETVEIDSDNYNTSEEIANAIISTLNNTTPSTMNATETKAPEFSELSHAATNIVLTAENDGDIYRRYVEPLRASLVRKLHRGVALNPEHLAASFVMKNILAAAVAGLYASGWLNGNGRITAAERRESAAYLAWTYISDARDEFNANA